MRHLLHVRSVLLAAAMTAVVATACTTESADVEMPEPAEQVADAPPLEAAEQPPLPLAVSGDGLEWQVPGSESATAVAPGEVLELGIGETVQVQSAGWAELQWPPGWSEVRAAVRGHLLPGAVLTLNGADTAVASLELDQSGGAGRYWVAPMVPPVEAEVHAGPLTVVANQGATNFIVMFEAPGESAEAQVPVDQARSDTGVAYAEELGDASVIWVVVASGEAEVRGCRPQGGAATAQVCVISSGRAASFTRAGELIETENLRPSVVETWFAGVAAGRLVNPLAVLAELTPTETPPPTETPVPLATSKADFTADQVEIQRGTCTMVRWSVAGAATVTLDGTEVEETGVMEVCPSETTTYTLRWTSAAGVDDESEILVAVVGQAEESRDRDEEDEDEDQDSAPAPEPTETECVGPECGEPTSPWVFPTAPPLPTSPPEPTELPPEPTEEPPPEPTEPPPEPPEPEPTP